jgi:hypothetical protein
VRKLLIGLVILVAFLAAVLLLLKSSKPKPGPIVFDMKYRGLSGAKDEVRYNSYWGFGGREKEVIITQETGPLAGKLEGKLEITIK